MKTFLFILLCMFTLNTSTIYAQEIVNDSKALKLQAKEEKRKAKEEKKAKEKQEKQEKQQEKQEKKDKKIEKLRAEYAEFIANYKPLETNTGYAEVDTFMANANELFEMMVNVEQEIGYIEVVVEEVEDPLTGEMVSQATGIRNKNTLEPIRKKDAWKAYGLASLQLTTAATQGATLLLDGTNVVLSSITDPMALITVGGKAKKVFKQIKMAVNIIPIIQRDIKENKEALKFYKDNLDGDDEVYEEDIQPETQEENEPANEQ